MLKRLPALALILLLPGCALQPPAATALPPVPGHWTHLDRDPKPAGVAAPADWWTPLADPGIDALVPTALAHSPSLDLALARLGQARAALASADAGRVPRLNGSLSASRGTSTGTVPIVIENQATAALSASWEADLFGRLGHGSRAAADRVTASEADVALAGLALGAQVADTVLLRRACVLTLARQQATLDSALTTLGLTEQKQQAGFASPLDVARSRTSVGEARANVVASTGQCQQYDEILADLTGLDSPAVAARLASPAGADAMAQPGAPDTPLALPADVLTRHPALRSALANADAAWEDIGQARAGRLPSLSLSALLSVSRIQIGRFDQSVNGWSFGPALAGALFDGGSGAANVSAAQARHAQALASLAQTLRDTVRDVELALIQGNTAREAEMAARNTLTAAEDLFRASEAAQRAGRLSLFDLEVARSALLAAQTSLVAARRDRARAWVALVKASGDVRPVDPALPVVPAGAGR